jgi:hypothetical protein
LAAKRVWRKETNMIPPSVVKRIRRLLAEGRLSGREIARLTGVSRGSVTSIARGKRREPPPAPAKEVSAGPLTRCPGCGGMVHMPCRLCRLRARAADARLGNGRAEEHSETIDLELSKECRARYEQVRLGAARPETPERVT